MVRTASDEAVALADETVVLGCGAFFVLAIVNALGLGAAAA